MRDDRLRRAVAFGLDSGASRRRVRRADSTIRGFDAVARDRIVFSFLARARRVDVSYATSRFAHVVRARSAIGRSAGGRSRRLAIGRSGGSLRATRTDGRASRSAVVAACVAACVVVGRSGRADGFAGRRPARDGDGARDGDDDGARENWALIVDASRYWFNYRHGANALSMYRSVKRMGIPDSRVVLMLADDHACDARNPAHGRVYGDEDRGVELYGDDVEVDYRGTEVTPERVIRVLTNRHERGTPRSKKLLPGARSNVLIYITGHGGDGFIKFQDQTELRAEEIADALAQMHARDRYNEVLFLADTCQAATLAKAIRSPRVLALSSSGLGENSYSRFLDPGLGVHVIDRFTYHVLEFFEKLKPESANTMGELEASLTPDKLMSRAVLDVKTFTHRNARAMKLSEFFGAVCKTRAMTGAFDWFVGAKSTADAPVDG